MKSSSFFVFCAPEELISWLHLLSAERTFGAIVFRDRSDVGTVFQELADLAPDPDAHRIFLYPASSPPSGPLSLNDVRSREWGWLDVRPGRLIRANPRDILTLSEMHGEDFDYEPVHPARYVRWLKRQLRKKQEIVSGVIGKNTVTGGEATYRDLNYSSVAATLHASGVLWKQLVDGRSVFQPARSRETIPRES